MARIAKTTHVETRESYPISIKVLESPWIWAQGREKGRSIDIEAGFRMLSRCCENQDKRFEDLKSLLNPRSYGICNLWTHEFQLESGTFKEDQRDNPFQCLIFRSLGKHLFPAKSGKDQTI